MKFSVSQLGRIASATIEIKPLTVFVGKANTNKTWTAYALYGLLRSLSRNSRLGTIAAKCTQFDDAINTVVARTTEKVIRLWESQPGDVDATSISVEVSRDEILSVAHPIGETLQFSFDNDDVSQVLAVGDVLSNCHATIEFNTQDFISRGKLYAIVIQSNKQLFSIIGVSRTGHSIHRFAFSLPPNPKADDLKKQFQPHIRSLVEIIFDEAMAFPAERKGLSAMLGFLDGPRREPFSPTLNQACIDYIRFLSTIQRGPIRPSTSQSRIVEHLEQQVMNGKADFHGPLETRVFSFSGHRGPTVHINASASFVRSMAGFDLYLRAFPAGHDVIVIDEPEMNAHPEAQLKLAELFAIMANQGRTIIITTHSPYFVDHLNNLMHGARLKGTARKQMSSFLKLQDEEAFISSDNAAAYLFGEDGVVTDLVSDGSVDVDSFARETDYLSDLYSRLRAAESETD